MLVKNCLTKQKPEPAYAFPPYPAVAGFERSHFGYFGLAERVVCYLPGVGRKTAMEKGADPVTPKELGRKEMSGKTY